MDPDELDSVIRKLVYEKCEEHAKTMASPWALSPQTIPGYITVITILVGIAIAYSDFKVNMSDLASRLTTQSERMTTLDKRIDDLNDRGSRPVLSVEADVKNLKDQFDSLKDALDSVNGAIQQHNESMYDLYKKTNPKIPIPPHHPYKLNYVEPTFPDKG